MKKAIVIFITAVAIFTLVACVRSSPVVTGSEMTLEEELEAVKGIQEALQELSESASTTPNESTRVIEQEIGTLQEVATYLEELTIFGDDALSNRDAGLQLEFDPKTVNTFDGKYTEFPYYAFMLKQPGENELTGNHYFVSAYTGFYDYYGFGDEMNADDFFVFSVIYFGFDFDNEELIWENNKYVDIAVYKNGLPEEWHDIIDSDQIILYFTYMGYSEVFEMPYGQFDYSEPLHRY